LADVGLLDGKRDFFLFEHGIEPDWDDAGNVRGGLWLVHCNECLKADVNDGVPDTNFSLDTLWRETVCNGVAIMHICTLLVQRTFVAEYPHVAPTECQLGTSDAKAFCCTVGATVTIRHAAMAPAVLGA
jgi:Eukaryotic initiation factor 4E